MTVYAIGRQGEPLVKIGYTDNLHARLHTLRMANPGHLDVLGCWPGGTDLERRVHRAFAELRHHGEWFDFEDRDPVAEVAAVVGSPPAPFRSEPLVSERRRERRRIGPQPAPCPKRQPHLVGLGAELRRIRKLAGVSQGALGLPQGLWQATVSRIENGRRLPTTAEVGAWRPYADDEAWSRVQGLLGPASLIAS